MFTDDNRLRDWILLAISNDRRASELERDVRTRTTWVVKRVRSGEMAVRALSGNIPTVALVDSELPIISCEEFVYIARRRPIAERMALVVVEFGRLDRSREATVIAAGADEYVDGNEPSGIWRRVETVLIRRRVTPSSAISARRCHQIDGMFVDLDRSFVSVDGTAVVRQPLEFALLQYFLERKNCVITREELWRTIWHKDEPMRGRTIDVHICRLRRRLGAGAARLQTLVRRGYRFVG